MSDPNRRAKINRDTNETKITVEIDLDNDVSAEAGTTQAPFDSKGVARRAGGYNDATAGTTSTETTNTNTTSATAPTPQQPCSDINAINTGSAINTGNAINTSSAINAINTGSTISAINTINAINTSSAINAINTGSGFLNHMLTLFAFHSGYRLKIDACGDTDVDYHHLTEDIGIALGQCIKQALGDGKGIARYADTFLPMDETLVLIALDISGRAYLNYDVTIIAPKVGDFDTELAQEFLMGLCRSLGLTLHVKQFYGTNAHHIIEAIFKGLGRALATATGPAPSRRGAIPSTKGLL